MGSNWSSGAVPTSAADVTISPASPTTVTIQAGDAESANSLTFGGKATLLITGGSLTTVAGLTSSGAITVAAGCTLTVGGSYTGNNGSTLSLPAGGDPTFPVSNLISNSGFESPTATKSTTKPSNWSSGAYLSTQYAYAGLQSLVTTVNTSADESFAVTPGNSYTVSVYAMMPASNPLTGTTDGQLQLLFYDSTNTLISGSYSAPDSINVLKASSTAGGPLPGSVGDQGWNHFWTTAVAPVGAVTVHVQVHSYASGAGGGLVYWDNVTFGPSVPGPSQFTAASISNSGSITVGPSNKITASGTLAQSTTGTLDIQIGNSPSTNLYGTVAATGAAALAGTLKAELLYGYAPTTTDVFTPITYASETGAFSSSVLPSGSGYQFAGSASFTNVVLSTFPTATLTATVNVTNSLHPVATNLLGTNIQYKDKDATTSQTQQMLSAAGVQMIRIPGGSYSDLWHFNVNYAASVGYDNFAPLVQCIAAIAATGVATIDYGSASPQEGAAELAYTLGSPSDTTVIGTGLQWNETTSQWQNVDWGTVGYWASLRGASPLAVDDGLNFLRLSHPAPFTNMKYWEVGNEVYGSWEIDHHGTAAPGGISTGAQHDPATYAAFAVQFASLANEITSTAGLPTISIGVVSADPTGTAYSNWTKNVLIDGASAGFVPGFLVDHNYMMSGGGNENDFVLLNQTVSDPASILNWATRYADYQALLSQTLSSPQAAGVQILGTEYNSSSGYGANSSKQSTSLVDGLFIAESIGGLLQSGYQGACVWNVRDDIGNYDSWSTNCNLSNLLYGWREGGQFGQLGSVNHNLPPTRGPYVPMPSYFGEQLVSKIAQVGGQVVSATSNYGELQVYAVQEASGHLDLMVINTNPAADLTEQFNLSGFQPSGSAQVWQYGKAQDTAQSQSSDGSSALASSSTAVDINAGSFSYTFPAYSMTVLDLGAIAGMSLSAGAAYTVTGGASGSPTLTATTGTVTLGQDLAASLPNATLSVANGANVVFTANQTLAALSLATGATAKLQASGTPLLKVGSLSLTGTATLDLGSGGLAIAYGTGNSLYNQVKGWITAARGSGGWTGSGITSSAAQANSLQVTLGYAEASDANPSGGLFLGQSVDVQHSVLVRATWWGDGNLDGKVNGRDFLAMTAAALFNKGPSPLATWYNGDYNGDGKVNGQDFLKLTAAGEFNKGSYDASLTPTDAPAAEPALTQAMPAATPATEATSPAATSAAPAIAAAAPMTAIPVAAATDTTAEPEPTLTPVTPTPATSAAPATATMPTAAIATLPASLCALPAAATTPPEALASMAVAMQQQSATGNDQPARVSRRTLVTRSRPRSAGVPVLIPVSSVLAFSRRQPIMEPLAAESSLLANPDDGSATVSCPPRTGCWIEQA